MTVTGRKWERLTDEEKSLAIEELITYFEKEREERIGQVAAENLLNFFLAHVGTYLYNKGVMDAKTTLERRLEDVYYDIDDLLDV